MDELTEEKVSILKDMFPNLTRALIFEHLTSSGGQIDSAIESILAATIDEVGEPLSKYEIKNEESDEEDDSLLRTVPLRTTAFVPASHSNTDTSLLQSESSPPPKSLTSSNSTNSSFTSNTSLSDKQTPTNTNDILKNFEYLYAGGFHDHNEVLGDFNTEESINDALRNSQQKSDLELAIQLQKEEEELSLLNVEAILSETTKAPESPSYEDVVYSHNPVSPSLTLVPPPPVMGGPLTKSWEDAEKLDKNLPKRYGVKINRSYMERIFKKKTKWSYPKPTGITVYNIIKPEFVHRFEAKRKELQKKYGKWHPYTWPTMVYHSTKSETVNSIIKNNLKVPDGVTVSHATDNGWYGNGVYFSPELSTALSYGDKKSIIVCSVLLGKVYRCHKRIDGQPLKAGYDSHREPYWNSFLGTEYILFNSDQILPCYFITTKY